MNEHCTFNVYIKPYNRFNFLTENTTMYEIFGKLLARARQVLAKIARNESQSGKKFKFDDQNISCCPIKALINLPV